MNITWGSMMLGMVTMISMPFKLAIVASKKMLLIIQRVPAIDAYATDGAAPSPLTPGAIGRGRCQHSPLTLAAIRRAGLCGTTEPGGACHESTALVQARSFCATSASPTPRRPAPRSSRASRSPSRRARAPPLSEAPAAASRR